MSKSSQVFFQGLVQQMLAHRNETDAKQMKQYMRNLYEFLGIKAPVRKAILKAYLAEHPVPQREELEEVVQQLWDYPYREMQHMAMDVLEKHIRHGDLSLVNFMEQLVLQKSWWDTVDILATRIGLILLKYPEAISSYSEKWIESNNIWWQRVAILFQLKYKSKIDETLLFKNILRRIDSKEFFIQKASGWALREYSKTQGDRVVQFIEENPSLSNLSKREGLKWLRSKAKI